MASIYETIKNNPDAALPNCPGVPGAYEGTLLRGKYKIKQSAFTEWKASRIVKMFILDPTDANMAAVEKMITKYTAITIADYIISFLSRDKLSEEQLSKAGLKLIETSESTEAVKLGITLLGRTKNREAAEKIETLSYCEEFTLYGAVAVKNILPQDEADAAHMRIAEKVHGWGKIALMYELNYDNESIREWTVKHGCENDIGLSYLANVCAIKGKMASYMESRDCLDNEAFHGIYNIFKGLLDADSQNDGIYDYPEAVKATRLFKELVEKDPAQKSEASDIIDRLPIT